MAVIAIPVVVVTRNGSVSNANVQDNPGAFVPQRKTQTSHVDLMAGPYEDGQAVTACLP